MDTQAQIAGYIASLAPAKRGDLQTLHDMMLNSSRNCRLWFLDGRNEAGKVVSNPSAGYGVYRQRYASGEERDFYRLGLSANTAGISFYVMGLDDRKALAQSYGTALGKAKITGYCIKFRRLADVNLAVIEQIVRDHLGTEAA